MGGLTLRFLIPIPPPRYKAVNTLRQDPYLFTLTPQLTCIECSFFLMFIAHKAQSLANMWGGGGRDCKYKKIKKNKPLPASTQETLYPYPPAAKWILRSNNSQVGLGVATQGLQRDVI